MIDRAGRSEFDAVVVGSGFGGSVTAYRLAEAGMRVCLLERGRAYPPGSFARSPRQMTTNFWDPTQGLFGLFDFWSFVGLDVMVSSGLGGGSLIYANVLMRKDERWFAEDAAGGGLEPWPVTRAELDPHYDRVERMIAPQTYPFEHPPYDGTNKTRAFREAAERLGLEWFAPNLAVTFANDGSDPVPGEPIAERHPNLHGRTRLTCRLCGECDIGCNYGSKNTLDYNYLSEAQRLGAELRTGCDVRAFEPLEGGGYSVGYIDYGSEPDGPVDILDPAHSLERITARRLVLACGALGTTRLLLRNRAAVPRISDRLGTRFSGNGDLLTFAHRCTDDRDGERVPRPIDPALGPVITTAIRYGDELDGDGSQGRGFYIEDAGFPQFMVWLLQTVEMPRDLWRLRGDVLRLARESMRRDSYRHTGRSAVLAHLFGQSDVSSGLLPLLGMGRDVPDGRMYLRHNHLRLDWRKGPGAGRRGHGRSGPFFDRLRHESERLAGALGAEFRDSPLWMLNRVISVHPLGGCPMGRNPSEGVVSPSGEVFGYPGLHVADGSVMRGPVGANPCLTIAALADRFCDRIIDEQAGEEAVTEHNGSGSRRRSLILAGGGLKVAFQAGVLQVWLDEAGLEFDHVDAASGGVFNLAMLCQGMSGGEVADNWRGFPARSLVNVNWRRPLRLVGGESIATLKNLRRKLFPHWGLDFDRIRSSPLEATFNTYNFSRHELEVIPPERLTEDLLVSCVSLPMWFPQVEIEGETYIDSVFITDANVEEAIRRGADELWIVWSVSERSEWQRGFIGNYFSVIETAANGHFRRILRRIEESNAAIARGEDGEFGRTIDVHLLRGEVPLHYLLNLSGDRFTEAVERGVDAARRWCEERGIPLRPREVRARGPATRLWFTETMAGSVRFGATDFDASVNGGGSAKPLSVTLTITADDLERFMFEPAHEARVEGHVQCEDLGGRLPVEQGTFNLFVDDGDPAHKRMRYRLHFRDGVGHPLTLAGHKVIETETGRGLWRDTTTLYTRVLKGHVGPGGDDAAEPVAAGIIRISPLHFARQLTTFRASGPTAAASMSGLMRFGALFAGGLWDVYARRILPSSPV